MHDLACICPIFQICLPEVYHSKTLDVLRLLRFSVAVPAPHVSSIAISFSSLRTWPRVTCAQDSEVRIRNDQNLPTIQTILGYILLQTSRKSKSELFLECFHPKIFWQLWGSSLCHWDVDLYRWVVGLGSAYTFSSYLPIRWYEDRVNETMMCRTRMLPTCDSGHVIHIDETCKLQWKSSLPSLECNRFVSVWLCATYCAQSQISGRDLCRWGVGLRCGWALVAAKMSPIPEEVPGHSETLSQH
jgi:hypothetical protein